MPECVGARGELGLGACGYPRGYAQLGHGRVLSDNPEGGERATGDAAIVETAQGCLAEQGKAKDEPDANYNTKTSTGTANSTTRETHRDQGHDDQQESNPTERDSRREGEAITKDKANTDTTIVELFGDTRRTKTYVHLGRLLTQPRPRGVAARRKAAVTRWQEQAGGTACFPLRGKAETNFPHREGAPP